MTIKVVESHY